MGAWRMIPLAVICALFIAPHAACKKSEKAASVQMPAVAGMFYPASKAELQKMVRRDLAQAPLKQLDGELMGLIAPHAGYQYSGSVAAAAFRQVEGKAFKRVIVMAPSHRAPLAGVALTDAALYRTPLGDIPIDVEAVKKLVAKYPWAKIDAGPYAVEHSLEVELPFLQETLGAFKLIPMIIGDAGRETLVSIAAAIDAAFPADETLLVASSDLSHFHAYETASDIDHRTIEIVCKESPEAYYDKLRKDAVELCGSLPVFIMKEIAKRRGARLELIEYANSGDTAGDRSRVVGYAAIAVILPKSAGLGSGEKEELLKLARATVEAHVRGKKLPALPSDPSLKKDGAAFVTLKKRGELRGCIGQIIAQGPLDQTVQQMAVAASSSDPRFPPVRTDELKDITVEISVLTAPEPLPDPLAVRVGTDGLIIQKGFNRGVLLPQVPTEQGWDKKQYLDGICQKAGMATGCWKDARLDRFQAIVFGEKR